MKNHRLLALAAMTWLPLGSAMAEQPLTPASLTPCPYTQEEIEKALNLKVNAGEAAEMKFPASRDVGCLYQVAGAATTLAVRQTWDPTGDSGKAQPAAAGARTEAIPGDPDGAQWKIGGGDRDEPTIELTYTRGKVQTRVLIHGRSLRETEMQSKLLKLRRVP